MPFPRLIPTTVEGVVRSSFRALAPDERLLLAADPATWDGPTVDAFVGVKRRLMTIFLHTAELARGNTELLEDVRRRTGEETTIAGAARYLFVRLLERAWKEKNYFPETVAQAANVLESELSDGERTWLMTEPLTEHGLLMRELVTWCMRRFGLEGANKPLIAELTTLLENDAEPYHPRLAARYVIQQLVLASLADAPELAERFIRRETAASRKRRQAPVTGDLFAREDGDA